eukprot:10938873-Alexandrium_andersonii.AAC.1
MALESVSELVWASGEVVRSRPPLSRHQWGRRGEQGGGAVVHFFSGLDARHKHRDRAAPRK